MMWFDPDDWCGKEITFPDDPTVTWVLDQKLDEKFCQRTQERSIPPHDPCAAWAVFSCKQNDGQGEKHAMKIWMQYDRQSPLFSETIEYLLIMLPRIPYTDTEFKPAASRKAQAQENLASGAKDEIKALGLLGANGSKHSPTLVRVINAKQDNDGMVPTGFITYILMTWCPGVPLVEKDYYSKPKEEREAIRHAFKKAWKYVISYSR
jgi:hypothetical protein